MTLHVGIKSDPIEHRFTHDWLFGLMAEHGIRHLQLGSFFALYGLDDEWFLSLARRAEKRGIRVASLFTSHRELGGCMSGDPHMEAVTRRSWDRLIRAASLTGASSAGSSAGSVMRDRPETAEAGIQRWFGLMKDLTRAARKAGLEALTVEPMSSAFEFPSTAEEIHRLDAEFDAWHAADPQGVVPLYYCADISHGVADASGRVIADNWRMFEMEIPRMWEFHFKNTDAIFNATFGFSPAEQERGIVDLRRLKDLITRNAERFPGREVIGYLEHPGPKVGREYTDSRLKAMLADSLGALVEVFGNG